MNLMVFQSVALILLMVFFAFISDFRNKKGMIPLLNNKIISFLKCIYIIPALIYSFVIIKIEHILFPSYFGLIFTFIGTLLVIKAKLDLGKYHTWAGHILSSTRIVTKGIYAFIRHPIYTGTCLFLSGGLIIGINNNPFSFFTSVGIIIFVCSFTFFLVDSAIKEGNFLQEMFGEKYLDYKRQVHAFLPIRKYDTESDIDE